MLRLRIRKHALLSCLCGLGLLGMFPAAVQAQTEFVDHRRPAPIIPLPQDCPTPPTTTPLTPPSTVSPTPAPTAPEVSLSGLSFARGGDDVFDIGLGAKGGAYLDSAIPSNVFRLRYDSAYGNNRPDRAEFFYGKCGCFRAIPISQGGDPSAPGPLLPETSVNYQDVSAYLELAFLPRLSAFIDLPVRFLNPEQNANETGLGDMSLGFKYAFLQKNDQWMSFQFRTSLPTGDAGSGLGINIVRLEPALLYLNKVSDKLIFQAEVRDSIPIGGTDFAGNVLRYGVGLSYDVYQRDKFFIEPVAEMVGWSVLSGKEITETGVILNASGDFILNAKAGVRIGVGANSNVYFGYARALTGEVWYRDSVRAEFRFNF